MVIMQLAVQVELRLTRVKLLRISLLCLHAQSFMKKHNFSSIDEFRGASLPYFTTHSDLVARQVRCVENKVVHEVFL